LVRENLQVFCHWSSLAGVPASAKNGNDLHFQGEYPVKRGSLSPQHGASSGCGWRNGLHYGG